MKNYLIKFFTGILVGTLFILGTCTYHWYFSIPLYICAYTMMDLYSYLDMKYGNPNNLFTTIFGKTKNKKEDEN
jgi:hypothetical protein